MKCEIMSVDIFRDADELLRFYPCLKDFNFEIATEMIPIKTWIRDETGERIEQISHYKERKIPYVTVDTIEALRRLIEAIDKPVIIAQGEDGCTIEIYDNYRE